MSHEVNKDIEILLRKLGRREKETVNLAEGVGSARENHLDADELNAYAENALPTSVRTRYTEHLADCRTCRTIVAQLSASYQPLPARDRTEEASPSALRRFLAALFSPLGIRYAVPTLAAVILAVTAWIFVSRPSTTDQMARKVASPAPASAEQSPTTGQFESAVNRVSEATAKPENVENKQSPRSGQTETSADVASKPTDEFKRDVSEDRTDLAKTDQPKAADVPAAPSVGAVTVATAPATTEVHRSKAGGEKKAEEEGARREAQTEQDRRGVDASRSGPYQTQQAPRENVAARKAPSSESSRQRAATQAEANEKDKSRDDDSEVRSVGGHRFTKRGSVWIDSLYRSSQATVNVTRGSDQYRALIGDEPGLKVIAEQFSGEVIVVWKGRAYRFR